MSHHINRFQLMAKPSGAVCNIDCTYCYYLEKQRLYPQRQAHWKMDGATLENYVLGPVPETARFSRWSLSRRRSSQQRCVSPDARREKHL